MKGESIGKKTGKYLTIEVVGIRESDTELQKKVEEVFAKEFAHFLKQSNISQDASCLVVGSRQLECDSRCSWATGL